ncbi:PaaX family transcriptional regulator C-terminal domain-containing protein [Cupriavidus malaysiensis]|uniref:Phenylacetic acid degradation operon negative regulatory protein PaaX n=1 Tax=Cupriavidus malaysiensis TaxID=367825 RepID=A0ABN4TPE5_9BURK|nr:PaaX family transcriptional regulator C-terminal domain-containing protein [Cupriavidus malaysiensis]AOZ09185.1 hypothetical protein BKK80_25555 [Cupriavidus malaysiensis]AOZ09192.1 hypothetical protein BKK80_25590 [Cupriavidus malaysiensis]
MAKAATTKARQVSWEELSAGLAGQVPFSPKAIISTVFGDMLSPGRGSVWLSSIVQLVSAFGLEASHVRTAALRLVYDGWLDAVRSGKYSYYSLSKETFENTRDYFERVYGEPRSAWDGSWQIVLFEPDNLDKRVVADLKLRLQWLGFGPFAPNLYAAPGNDPGACQHLVRELKIEGKVQILSATPASQMAPAPMEATIRKAWRLDAVEAGYRDFIALFGPVQAALSDGAIPPAAAFQVRTLLVLAYRRIVLQDPKLPLQLLPSSWAGTEAHALCRALYFQLLPPSEVFLAETVQTSEGVLAPVSDEVLRRFGGAPSAAPVLQGRRRAAKAPAA